MIHCRVMTDFFVETISTNRGSNQAFVSPSLGPKQIPFQFKLDTGSQANVIPERIFSQLHSRAPLGQPERHLSAHTGDKLGVRGRCKLKCKYKEQDSELELYVVNTQSSPIFGLKSCLDLELIKSVYSVDREDTLDACDTPGLDKTTILAEDADVLGFRADTR